ncbi:MAG: thioredoxin family protein [Bacteroidales bacterium]
MARTETNIIPLGFTAPNFYLPDILDGSKKKYFRDICGPRGTVVIFMCNHCPFVIHIIDELVKVSNDYCQKGISIVGINSNDIENYPEDSPENMILFAKEHKIKFPYFFDKNQNVAKEFDAACTPDFNVFDSNDICVYRGQFDDARPGNGMPINGTDLRKTLDLLLEEKPIPTEQKPSIGCNIKWK